MSVLSNISEIKIKNQTTFKTSHRLYLIGPPAHYNPEFNQKKCLACPSGMTSPRGAISIDNCSMEKRDICQVNLAICGPHGICMQEHGNRHLYSCLCEDGFTGQFLLF